jgi:hypothetical protein
LGGIVPDLQILAVVTLSKTQEEIEVEISNAMSTAEGKGWRFIKKVVEPDVSRLYFASIN